MDVDPKYPYVPCCYSKDQTKKIKQIQTEKTVKSLKVSDYIFDADKRLQRGRYGDVNEMLKQILVYHNIKKEMLRLGTDDILDACAAINNFSAWLKNPDSQRKKIANKIQKSDMIYSASQSFSQNELKDVFKMASDPAGFHPILEYLFDATVLLLEDDTVMYPNSQFGFIPRLIKHDKCIILFKHKKFPQIDILMSKKDKEIFLTRPSTVSKILTTKKQVFGFRSFKKTPTFKVNKYYKLASAQYLDEFGKNRGFLINNQTIFLPPTAPVDLPVETEIKYGKIKVDLDYYEAGVGYTDILAVPTKKDLNLPLPPRGFIKQYIVIQPDFISSAFELSNKDVQQDSHPEIVTLYTIEQEQEYLDGFKKRSQFEWQTMRKLRYVAGKTDWVLADDDTLLQVENDGDDGLEIAYDSLFDSKISKTGNGVVYPNKKIGKIK